MDDLRTHLLTYYSKRAPSDCPQLGEMTPLAGGWASDIYRFTLRRDHAGTASSEHLVLKTYAPTAGGIDTALREYHALHHLGAAGYPVPGVMLVEPDSAFLGRPFVIMEWVDGQLLWGLLEAANEAQRESLTRLFVKLLIDLHALGPNVLVPEFKLTDEYGVVDQEISTLRVLIEEHDRKELMPVVTWLHERRHTVPCDVPVVIHRDYHPWNVLMSATGSVAVLDWDWGIGDPRFDLAWMLTLMERSGFGDFRDRALVEYERVRGGPVEALGYFEVLTSTRWLLNVTHDAKPARHLRSEVVEAFRAFIAEPVRRAVAMIDERTGVRLSSAPRA